MVQFKGDVAPDSTALSDYLKDPENLFGSAEGDRNHAGTLEEGSYAGADADLEWQLLMLPQSSASSGEVGTGLFAPATEYIPTGGSSLGPLFSAHQPSAWNLDPLPLAQEGPIPHHNLSSDWHSFLHTSRGGFIEESNSQHQFGDTGSRLDAPSEYANSQHYAPAQSGASISSPSESVSTYRNLPDHTLSTPLASDNYPLPSNSPFLSGWQEPLHVSIETTRRLSILEQLCNSPSTNSSTWSSHSSLFSTPSSVTQSPLVNTPSMMQRPSLVGVGYSPSTHYNLALSPVSAAAKASLDILVVQVSVSDTIDHLAVGIRLHSHIIVLTKFDEPLVKAGELLQGLDVVTVGRL
ncbi:hypothetical protein EV361DRAFT_361834 [Lentinula raphanica]|nr:hypothetical protein EV361DRAFT_361834 [Lentinula raphanica]